MAALDRRKVFRFSPCSRESRVVTRMIGSRFFLTNPTEAASSPPASMYFDPIEAAAYQKEHPDAKFWTVVDADSGNGQFLEQGVRFVNRVAYLIEDLDWKPPRKARTADERAVRDAD